MTDIALPGRSIDLSSEAARRRIRRRYRAEARFRAYGIAAILFALAFLVFLIGDIVIKAMPAFTTYSLSLEVEPTREALGLEAADANVATGDFMAPIRAALLEAFPYARDDRKLRQRLTGLISSGGTDALRATLLADPAQIGDKPVATTVKLSDDADLFYKGMMTRVEETATRGSGSPSATEGAVTVLSSANDFSAILVEVKRALSAEARELRSEVARFEDLLAANAADRTEAEAALAAARVNAPADIASLEGAVAKLDADRASIEGQIAGLGAKAAELETRFNAASAAETLDASVPSVVVEINGGVVRATEIGNDRIVGETLAPLTATTDAAPGTWRILTFDRPEAERKLSDQELVWLTVLKEKGLVTSGFNWAFFTSGDSREAELAGILGALVGSLLTMLVTLVTCLPIGVAAAIYLEEFAPKNRWTDVIEVNINNLAAVPSIIFGLLGLAIFLNFFGLPRSAPLVGGLVLALLVLPTIIIASRAALKAVPPSIREAALGVGASHQQAVFHHVLPLAMPGILTGTIIGMAHALGESAPLLLIGMVAFIVDVPHGITDAATVLPVQIYLWSDLPEVGFQAKTSAAIIVLLLFLLVMNGAAILLRKRFERRW
jgi:phosphate transport system permease protein